MGLTDETFAVLSLSSNEKIKTASGMAGLIVSSFSAWVLGTIIGIQLASILSEQINKSMVIALYALFVGLLVSALYNKPQYIYVTIIAIVVNYIGLSFMSSSGSLILATVLSPLISMWALRQLNAKH